MTTEVNQHIGLEGIFNFKLTNTKTGEIREYEFKNLILNSGIDHYLSNNLYFMGGCKLGSSSVEPQVTDTTMTGILGTSTTLQASGNAAPNTTVLPYYISHYWTYRFIEGVATGNIAQVAMLCNTTNALFSLALVKDGNGTPITITKLADEVLDVTYTLRMYAPELDVTGTTTISGVDYTYIVRPSRVGYWGLTYLPTDVYIAEARTGLLGNQLGEPTGSGSAALTKTFATYVVGTHTRTVTIFWDLNQGNLSGGIRSIYMVFGPVSYSTPMFCYQVEYTAVTPVNGLTTIPKDATKRLTLKYQFTVGRV